MYVILAILLLGSLIAIHEFGHYLAARWMGVTVREFAVGFGPKIWSTTRAGTDWVVRLIPLGGFVEMKGSDHFHPGPDESAPDSLNQAGPWRRLIIFLGGVTANYIGAVVALSIILTAGISQDVFTQADLDERGWSFAQVDEDGTFHTSAVASIPASAALTAGAAVYSIYVIPDMIERATTTSERVVGGPVSIVNQGSKATRRGFKDVLWFIWSISLALAVFNLLPFPGLDGGHILLLVPEVLLGRRLHPNLDLAIRLGGAGVLILFVLVITIQDIRHLFSP